MDPEEAFSCKLCGCSETNLVDGFYYCVECGTQNTNVRETVVDIGQYEEGALQKGRKQRIIKKVDGVVMSDDWYIWHALNLLMHTFGDELIQHGAKPSVKVKLLWIWTRYLKKYSKLSDLGSGNINNNEYNDLENDEKEDEMDYSSDSDYGLSGDEDLTKRQKKKIDDDEIGKLDAGRITTCVIVSILYAALNIDESHIQLSHLLKLIREQKVSVLNWTKIVPPELKPKKLGYHLKRIDFIRYCNYTLRTMIIIIFKKLKLGNPIVPDIRGIIDMYLKELCLPRDLNDVVVSLMYHRSFDYLDINLRHKRTYRMPLYEVHVISHIIMALKICFGLDDEYEYKLSDAVEKLNRFGEYPRSYKLDRPSQPTERLFSFREWLHHIKFRKIMLRTHTSSIGEQNNYDRDDYVAIESMNYLPEYTSNLKDEITSDILDKLPNVELNIMPQSEFQTTLTPHSTNTDIIIEHLRDPEKKMILAEDFTQYSLKYITEDMFLVDPDSANPTNILTGVSKSNKQATEKMFEYKERLHTEKRMVYIKDCDNHNWLKTLRPTEEHLVKDKKDVENDYDIANDGGYESNKILQEKPSETCDGGKNKLPEEFDSVTDSGNDDIMSLDCSAVKPEIETGPSKNEDILLKLQEDETKNIFDDDFLDLDTKKEEKCDDYEDLQAAPACETIDWSLAIEESIRKSQQNSDEASSEKSSFNSIIFAPHMLDRAEAIKELMLHACRKYKIGIPAKYKKGNPPKKQANRRPRINIQRVKKGQFTANINNLVADYESRVEKDVLNQLSASVQQAIEDAHLALPDADEGCEPPAETTALQEPEPNETDQDKYTIFDENSDGETYAEEFCKKNPKYDEKTHDDSQLYVKIDEKVTPQTMKLNPSLLKLIDEPQKPDEKKKDAVSDSDDEMPLSILLEGKRLREVHAQRRTIAKTKLFKTNQIPPYIYWSKRYNNFKYRQGYQEFYTYLDSDYPTSYAVVLRECSEVAGYSMYDIQDCLQGIEKFLENEYLRNKKKRKHEDLNQELGT